MRKQIFDVLFCVMKLSFRSWCVHIYDTPMMRDTFEIPYLWSWCRCSKTSFNMTKSKVISSRRLNSVISPTDNETSPYLSCSEKYSLANFTQHKKFTKLSMTMNGPNPSPKTCLLSNLESYVVVYAVESCGWIGSALKPNLLLDSSWCVDECSLNIKGLIFHFPESPPPFKYHPHS